MKRFATLAIAVLGCVLVVPALAATRPPRLTPAPDCTARSIGYGVSGTLTSAGSLTANADGTYNGSLTLEAHGSTQTYTLAGARVTFGNGVSTTAPAAGLRADLAGSTTTEPKSCSGFTPTTTIRRVVLHAAAPVPKCVAHAVSYEASGTLAAAGSLARNANGTYAGSLTVHVTAVDTHAKADKGTIRTYTLTRAHVSFGHGVDRTAPTAGSRVDVKGTITTEAKSCTGFTPVVTIAKVELHAAAKK